MNQIEQIRKHTVVVADTGDIEAIRRYKPRDATTNPSLIFAASQMEEYQHLIHDALSFGTKKGQTHAEQLSLAMDKVMVNFGSEILKIVPGRVSTEVDARLSFSIAKSVEKARHLIHLYEEMMVPRERVLIKLASTWEGIRAAEILKKEGIRCNMTLMFSLVQAAACAEIGAQLISPFVGRILDFYKKETGQESYLPHEDPGVLSVRQIYSYYKRFGFGTEIMGASFRNRGEILELVGLDLLTISPKLLQELEEHDDLIEVKLTPALAKEGGSVPRIEVDEEHFRWLLNENPMATEKLRDGIQRFAQDLVKLENILAKELQVAAG